MENPKKRREVASCTECYSKKQKCNHQYPCHHCVKRRKPELCTYRRFAPQRPAVKTPISPAARPAASSPPPTTSSNSGDELWESVGSASLQRRPRKAAGSNLSLCLGYATGSSCNLLGLMSQFHLIDPDEVRIREHQNLSDAHLFRMQSHLRKLPDRHVLDFLVQHVVKEVNWIYGLNHSTTLLTQYEQFWAKIPPSNSGVIDFAVMLLEIAAFSAQFLPSLSYTAETIHGASITATREYCHSLAAELATIHGGAGGLNSLTGVQYYCYRGNYEMNEGSIKDAWHLMGHAIRVAVDLGIHMEPNSLDMLTPGGYSVDELEIEMRRRVHWNLYIWDRQFSAVLDRQPFLKDEHCTALYPQMRLEPSSNDPGTPTPLTERTLQAKLARIWYSFLAKPSSGCMSYDPVVVEEQKDRLDSDFILLLPSYFQLRDFEARWDCEFPRLAAQRQLLHSSIFTLRCLMFRPLLAITSEVLSTLPVFKRNLFHQHRHYLVESALSLLNSAVCLHSNINANQTKFFLISFYTFEPAMILVLYLHSWHSFADDCQAMRDPMPPNLSTQLSCLADDQKRSLQAVSQAITKLESLREVSPIADFGANKLKQVMERMHGLETGYIPRGMNLTPQTASQEISDIAYAHYEYTPYSLDLHDEDELAWVQTLLHTTDEGVLMGQNVITPADSTSHQTTMEQVNTSTGSWSSQHEFINKNECFGTGDEAVLPL